MATPPPGPLGVAPTGVPAAQTFGNSLYGNNPTDTTDNVDSATGALKFEVTDLRVAGIGEPLALTRTYNSDDTTGGSFGPGWTSILDSSVTIVQHQTLTVRGEDGQQVVFTWNPGTKSWDTPPGAKATVSCTPVVCTVMRFDGVKLTFKVASSGPSHVASYVRARRARALLRLDKCQGDHHDGRHDQVVESVQRHRHARERSRRQGHHARRPLRLVRLRAADV